jgi:hypothetical protein
VAVPTRRELIDAAYAKLEANGPTDFARKLGLGVGGYLKVYRWTRQDGRLDYEDTIRMLDVLGWLRTEETPADLAAEFVRRLDAGEKIPARDRERVAAQVEALAGAYLRLAERLRAASQRATR